METSISIRSLQLVEAQSNILSCQDPHLLFHKSSKVLVSMQTTLLTKTGKIWQLIQNKDVNTPEKLVSNSVKEASQAKWHQWKWIMTQCKRKAKWDHLIDRSSHNRIKINHRSHLILWLVTRKLEWSYVHTTKSTRIQVKLKERGFIKILKEKIVVQINKNHFLEKC